MIIQNARIQAMLEAGIPFEYKYVSPYLGDNMKPEYKGHFAKIPLLIDPNNNNLAISESTTMLRYLSHRYPDKVGRAHHPRAKRRFEIMCPLPSDEKDLSACGRCQALAVYDVT